MGIKLGLVGLGSFGFAFAPLFKSHPPVDQVRLCDREPDRVARFADDPGIADKYQPTGSGTDFDPLPGTDIDAVVIITQPWLHIEQAIRALEAGKHVYSAVPVVMFPDCEENLAWWDRLIETCCRTGQRHRLGETTGYRPETMYCRRQAAERAFGTFLHADGHYPTHSASGPLSVMRTHATLAGTESLSESTMRDQLPSEVEAAFGHQPGEAGTYGGHGGSHGFLVNEFVSSIVENRQPAINAWEAARYMACGATAHKSALAGGEMLDVSDWGDAPNS